ncbi:ATP-binding protein [Sphingoaurantiacus capsulatus]|uniref:histidine kinase n=1 Tax=Sphingoaurantiacus capsulatus TaxID=1771310 RepID=A0ABV7XC21_9SPHN
MSRRLRWPDGLGGRIRLVLLAALLLQFVGGELIFRHFEAARIQRERAERVAGRLTVAERLLVRIAPDRRAELAADLWRDPFVVRWQAAAAADEDGSSSASVEDVRQLMLDRRPGLAENGLRLSRADSRVMEGSLRLDDGSWLIFRSSDNFGGTSALYHYAASVLLLLACAALVASLLARMINRPLRLLVQAADAAGREEPLPLGATASSPVEVRQVEIAFHAMQARLLELVRERVHSLAAVSHDLRTPLSRLRLQASMIDDDEARTAIEHSLDEMEAFIASILDYLRGDEPEPDQLADVASIVATVIDDAHDLGGEVDFAGPRKLEAVTQPLKLKRAIANVVNNAVRHAGGARVTLAKAGDKLTITVDDEGPGIPAEMLNAATEPFFRIETSRNRGTGGVGLGLAITRRLVDQLGGTLSLSNREAGGLSVTLRLPNA